MATNSAPTAFLDTSITMAGHVLPQQSDDVEKRLEDELKGTDEQLEESGKRDVHLKSNYASWTQAALMRKFWRMYLLGVLVAQGGMCIGFLLVLFQY